MATFPEPYIPDVMQGIRAHQSGYAFGRERRQNALASRAGGLAASGDIGGAANALLEGGDIQGGFAIQDRIRAMAKDADEQQLLKSQRANDAFFRLATVADTPQKWQMAIGQLRQMGVDTAGFDDFGSRDMAMARFGQTKDVLGTVLEERKARAIGQALLPQQADPAQADRRPTVGNAMQGWKSAIASNETANQKDPYAALGPVVQSGDRAYGKYQVMGANVGPWTREALGQSLTPQQFLASPEAQERVFEHRFGGYVQKYGSPEAAASVWFTGRPSAPNAQARNPDGSPLGITGQQYVDQFRAGLGQQNALAPQPTAGPNYDAGIEAALRGGDYETASRLQALKTGDRRSAGRIQEVQGRLVAEQPDGTFKEVYAAPPKAKNLTVQEQKEVFEADEGVQAATNVIGSLNRALALNEKAYSGPMAQTRGYGMSLFGAEGGTATEELQNVVLQQVLDNLKATFGAAPTEGERQILVDIQGSVSKAPEVRRRVFENAIAAANRRLAFNRNKAEAIRGGEYFQPGYQPSAAAPPPNDTPAGTSTPESTSVPTVTQQQYQALRKGARYIADGDPERKIRTKQ